MAKAKVNIPWLPMRVIVSRAARHLGCVVEYARLRIVQEAEAGGRIRACGLTVEGWPMSPLPAAWRGVDWDADIDLRLDDLIAADLLPASAERAEWPAVLALAHIIEGMPLEWKEWTAEMVRQAERAGIALGEAIGADQVLAWGRLTPQGPMEQIPGSDLRIPGFVWAVRPDGELGTSPPGQLAVFKGRRWYGIEIDSATLRQAFPKPLRVERRMLVEVEQLYAEGWPEPAARAEELIPEPSQAKPSKPESPLEVESVKPMPATTEEPPAAEPARLVSVKARRQAQATKRKARRKARKNSRITAAAAWAKNKSNLNYAEARERQPGKVDFYTECKAAVPDLTYNEFRAGLKIERDRRRVEAAAAARKS